MNIPALNNLLDRLRDVTYFTVTDNVLTELPTNATVGKTDLMVITIDELGAIDTRLPFIIKPLIEATAPFAPQQYKTLFFTSFLRDTIAHWIKPRTCRTAQGEELTYSYFIEFSHMNLTPAAFQVQVDLMTTQLGDCMDNKGNAISYVKRGYDLYHDLCPVWLAETFPGWEQRYVLAKDLGLVDRELVNAVLIEESVIIAPRSNSIEFN